MLAIMDTFKEVFGDHPSSKEQLPISSKHGSIGSEYMQPNSGEWDTPFAPRHASKSSAPLYMDTYDTQAEALEKDNYVAPISYQRVIPPSVIAVPYTDAQEYAMRHCWDRKPIIKSPYTGESNLEKYWRELRMRMYKPRLRPCEKAKAPKAYNAMAVAAAAKRAAHTSPDIYPDYMSWMAAPVMPAVNSIQERPPVYQPDYAPWPIGIDSGSLQPFPNPTPNPQTVMYTWPIAPSYTSSYAPLDAVLTETQANTTMIPGFDDKPSRSDSRQSSFVVPDAYASVVEAHDNAPSLAYTPFVVPDQTPQHTFTLPAATRNNTVSTAISEDKTYTALETLAMTTAKMPESATEPSLPFMMPPEHRNPVQQSATQALRPPDYSPYILPDIPTTAPPWQPTPHVNSQSDKRLDIIASAAAEAYALATLMNAEGERIQKSFTIARTAEELADVDENARQIMVDVASLEQKLIDKIKKIEYATSAPAFPVEIDYVSDQRRSEQISALPEDNGSGLYVRRKRSDRYV